MVMFLAGVGVERVVVREYWRTMVETREKRLVSQAVTMPPLVPRVFRQAISERLEGRKLRALSLCRS